MTCDSMDSRPIRVSRPHSRSTSLRASSGRSSLSSLARSSFRDSSSDAFSLSELLLDRLHLLAQVHLALPAAELLLDLGLDVLLGREDLDLPLDVHQHAPQPVFDGQRLEQRLLFRRRDVQVAGHQIGEPAGLLHSLQKLVDRLVGQAELAPQFRRALAHLVMESDECGSRRVELQHLPRLLDRRLEPPFLGDESRCDSAGPSFEQQQHAAEASLDGPDRGDRADRVEGVGSDDLSLRSPGAGPPRRPDAPCRSRRPRWRAAWPAVRR